MEDDFLRQLIVNILQNLREEALGGDQDSVPHSQDDRHETIQKDEGECLWLDEQMSSVLNAFPPLD